MLHLFDNFLKSFHNSLASEGHERKAIRRTAVKRKSRHTAIKKRKAR